MEKNHQFCQDIFHFVEHKETTILVLLVKKNMIIEIEK